MTFVQALSIGVVAAGLVVSCLMYGVGTLILWLLERR